MKDRITAADLTLQEKARLLNGMGSWHTYDCGGKTPSTAMSDGPHGLRKQDETARGDMNVNNSHVATCFPTASAIASSWNPDAAARVAHAIADEAKAENVDIVLGCGTNIKRTPLCGRNFEYFSEDPLLAGAMAASYIGAMEQSGTGTSLKHFACNNREYRRMTTNSIVDERALREIYLAPFEKAVKEGKPSTVMASYNLVNGVHACANRRLLRNILREEWGYEGLVISDWGATVDPARCLRAGLNLAMPDSQGVHTNAILKAVEDERIPPEVLDAAADAVLNFAYDHHGAHGPKVNYAVQRRIARAVEEESAVLLKHGGVLPVKPEDNVLLVGELAVNMRFQGAGSSHINIYPMRSAMNALGQAGLKADYLQGYRCDAEQPDPELENEVLEAVGEYDKVLFFCGLTELQESEGFDRKDLTLPENQLHLLHQLLKKNKNVAVISFGGAPVEMPFADRVPDILQMYLGGEAVGEACADLILGKANPSGKLAETWPMSVADIPSHGFSDAPGDTDYYAESIYVGYRYYETFHVPVRFPFGHGLSYTTFDYSGLQLRKEGTHQVRVTFRVKNTGSVPGAEVAQVYVVNPQNGIERPLKELRAFEKVFLEPGEEKEISLLLTERSFSVWSTEQSQFVVPEGTYGIAVGSSVQDIRLEDAVTLSGEKVSSPVWYDLDHDGLPVFSRDAFARLFPVVMPEVNTPGKDRAYSTEDSFETVCNASLPGRILKSTVEQILPLTVKGGRKSTAYGLMLAGVKESPMESLMALSGNALRPSLVEWLLKQANRNRK